MKQENIYENTKHLKDEINLMRKKIKPEKMNISFGEILNMYCDGEIIIRPEFQRLYRWNNNQKTAFIESLLLSIPVPSIFVFENENGIWEVIDGLQRISTFLSFFGKLQEEPTSNINSGSINKWVLDAGTILTSLKGLNIDTLPTAFKINLKRSACRIEILRNQSDNNSMKYEIFKRLNYR